VLVSIVNEPGEMGLFGLKDIAKVMIVFALSDQNQCVRSFITWATVELELKTPKGGSALGFGFPSAIAAKICKPELPVYSVVGDRGFLMTAGELADAVRENLKIVFILFTNKDLSLIRIKQEKKEMSHYGTSILASGTIGVDNIFGIPVLKANDSDAFRIALQMAFRAEGPTIFEAFIDGREYDGLVLYKDQPL